MSLHVDEEKDNVTIVLTGPSATWFGVGLNAQKMADMPYTIIVNSTGVFEQKIGTNIVNISHSLTSLNSTSLLNKGTCGSEADHCPGTLLQDQVNLVSNEIEGDKRSVVLTRSLVGVTSDHYTFNMSSSTQIPFIAAVGSSQTFAYHKAHDISEITLTTPGVPSCVCVKGTQCVRTQKLKPHHSTLQEHSFYHRISLTSTGHSNITLRARTQVLKVFCVTTTERTVKRSQKIAYHTLEKPQAVVIC